MTASITVRTVQVLPATRWRRTQLGVQCTLPDRQIPNKINTYLYLKREKKKKRYNYLVAANRVNIPSPGKARANHGVDSVSSVLLIFILWMPAMEAQGKFS